MPLRKDGYGTIKAPLICKRCGDNVEKVPNLAKRSPAYKGRRLPTRRKAFESPKQFNQRLIMTFVGCSTVLTAFVLLAFGLTSNSKAADLSPVDSVWCSLIFQVDRI